MLLRTVFLLGLAFFLVSTPTTTHASSSAAGSVSSGSGSTSGMVGSGSGTPSTSVPPAGGPTTTTVAPPIGPTTLAPSEAPGLINTNLFNFTSRGTIYTLGDMVMRNPVEGCAIFVSAVFVASLVEALIDYLRAIESDGFQLLFDSVREETLLVGIMTMFLIFVISFGVLRVKWEIMLNYAVMSLLLMVLFFIIIVSLVVVVLRVQLNRWQQFEGTRMDMDPLLSSREQTYKYCRDRFRESVVAKDAKFSREVQFTSYLKRVQHFTVARVTDLSWKSWAALAILIIINGVRSRFTTGFTGTNDTFTPSQRLANVASYIGFVGYGTLATYFILHVRLSRQLAQMASEDIVVKAKFGEGIEIKKPSERLFFGSMETTSHIVQSTLLFMEWYMAVFALGMVFESWREFGVKAVALYVAAIIPPAIYVFMLPWTLTIIAILSSLGEDLNIEEADACFEEQVVTKGGIQATAAASGKKTNNIRNDEYNGLEMMSMHKTSNNPMLDEEEPARISDARHVNAVPQDQRGFVVNKAGDPFRNTALRPLREASRPLSDGGDSFAGSPQLLSRESSMYGSPPRMLSRDSSARSLSPLRPQSSYQLPTATSTARGGQDSYAAYL